KRATPKSGLTAYGSFGDYTSDAGDLHQGVWFTDQSNHQPGDTVRPTVSGPDAGKAELFDPVNAAAFLVMASGGTVARPYRDGAVAEWTAPGTRHPQRAGHLTRARRHDAAAQAIAASTSDAVTVPSVGRASAP